MHSLKSCELFEKSEVSVSIFYFCVNGNQHGVTVVLVSSYHICAYVHVVLYVMRVEETPGAFIYLSWINAWGDSEIYSPLRLFVFHCIVRLRFHILPCSCVK